jgi:hypothetical protein
LKFIPFLTLFLLTGCGLNKSQPNTTGIATFEQLNAVKVTNADCRNIDKHVNFLENQLRMKGLLYADPDNLNNDDRLYNATARATIWALRIGCSNPDRYKQ